jgi:hypothetical protein
VNGLREMAILKPLGQFRNRKYVLDYITRNGSVLSFPFLFRKLRTRSPQVHTFINLEDDGSFFISRYSPPSKSKMREEHLIGDKSRNIVRRDWNFSRTIRGEKMEAFGLPDNFMVGKRSFALVASVTGAVKLFRRFKDNIELYVLNSDGEANASHLSEEIAAGNRDLSRVGLTKFNQSGIDIPFTCPFLDGYSPVGIYPVDNEGRLLIFVRCEADNQYESRVLMFILEPSSAGSKEVGSIVGKCIEGPNKSGHDA